MDKNSCYTYFRIVGDFDPETITDMLQLTPYETWKKGEKIKNRNNNLIHDSSSWIFGKCDTYFEDFSHMLFYQINEAMYPFLDKIEVLKQIKKSYDVTFYFEIVPTIYDNSSSTYFNLPIEVIDFCHETGTEIDIDYYLLPSTEN